MGSGFALHLDHEGIALHRGTGGEPLATLALDAAEFDASMAGLRARVAEGTGGPAGDDAPSLIVLPDSQILYTEIPASGLDEVADAARVRAALEGQTPYRLDELVYDWVVRDGTIRIAAVARETLEEAATFAIAHGFRPTGYAAPAANGMFPGRPVFEGRTPPPPDDGTAPRQRPSTWDDAAEASKSALKAAKTRRAAPKAEVPLEAATPAQGPTAQEQAAQEPAAPNASPDQPSAEHETPNAPAQEAADTVLSPAPSPAELSATDEADRAVASTSAKPTKRSPRRKRKSQPEPEALPPSGNGKATDTPQPPAEPPAAAMVPSPAAPPPVETLNEADDRVAASSTMEPHDAPAPTVSSPIPAGGASTDGKSDNGANADRDSADGESANADSIAEAAPAAVAKPEPQTRQGTDSVTSAPGAHVPVAGAQAAAEPDLTASPAFSSIRGRKDAGATPPEPGGVKVSEIDPGAAALAHAATLSPPSAASAGRRAPEIGNAAPDDLRGDPASPGQAAGPSTPTIPPASPGATPQAPAPSDDPTSDQAPPTNGSAAHEHTRPRSGTFRRLSASFAAFSGGGRRKSSTGTAEPRPGAAPARSDPTVRSIRPERADKQPAGPARTPASRSATAPGAQPVQPAPSRAAPTRSQPFASARSPSRPFDDTPPQARPAPKPPKPNDPAPPSAAKARAAELAARNIALPPEEAAGRPAPGRPIKGVKRAAPPGVLRAPVGPAPSQAIGMDEAESLTVFGARRMRQEQPSGGPSRRLGLTLTFALVAAMGVAALWSIWLEDRPGSDQTLAAVSPADTVPIPLEEGQPAATPAQTGTADATSGAAPDTGTPPSALPQPEAQDPAPQRAQSPGLARPPGAPGTGSAQSAEAADPAPDDATPSGTRATAEAPPAVSPAASADAAGPSADAGSARQSDLAASDAPDVPLATGVAAPQAATNPAPQPELSAAAPATPEPLPSATPADAASGSDASDPASASTSSEPLRAANAAPDSPAVPAPDAGTAATPTDSTAIASLDPSSGVADAAADSGVAPQTEPNAVRGIPAHAPRTHDAGAAAAPGYSPAPDLLSDLNIAAADPFADRAGANVLAPADRRDASLPTPEDPLPLGTTRGPDGFIVPTAEGARAPGGYTVYSGPPEVIPPRRPQDEPAPPDASVAPEPSPGTSPEATAGTSDAGQTPLEQSDPTNAALDPGVAPTLPPDGAATEAGAGALDTAVSTALAAATPPGTDGATAAPAPDPLAEFRPRVRPLAIAPEPPTTEAVAAENDTALPARPRARLEDRDLASRLGSATAPGPLGPNAAPPGAEDIALAVAALPPEATAPQGPGSAPGEPVAAPPETALPEAAQPETAEPETAQPGTAESESREPEAETAETNPALNRPPRPPRRPATLAQSAEAQAAAAQRSDEIAAEEAARAVAELEAALLAEATASATALAVASVPPPPARPVNLARRAAEARAAESRAAESRAAEARAAEERRRAEAQAAARSSGTQQAAAAAAVAPQPQQARPPAAASTASAIVTPKPAPANRSAPAVPRSQRISPPVPSSATVAKQATQRNALRMKNVTLIGVYGSATQRRALVRLPSGRYVKVQVGDRIDGGRVAAISTDALRYVKRGQSVTLSMPRG
ncbi:MAG: hypothetical protein AAFU80_17870 [Pseudomonadota bacterium]